MTKWEYSYGGTSFLPYIDGNGNEALVRLSDVMRVYKSESQGWGTIIETHDHRLRCSESPEALKQRLYRGRT